MSSKELQDIKDQYLSPVFKVGDKKAACKL